MVAIVVSLFGCFPGTAVADCGKIIIYYRVPRPVVVVPQPVIVVPRPVVVMPRPVIVQPTYRLANVNVNNTVINVNPVAGSLPPPRGGAVAFGDADKAFMEGAQQAVIAWNGKTDGSGEQTLILTTNEQSNTGEDMAMLSVLPLPGKPISIEPANTEVFVESKKLLDKKIREQNPSGGIDSFGVIMETKIGSHHIFVWEMDDISTFEEDVNAYIVATYGEDVAALVTPKALEIIKGYHTRKFRYFAFDLTLVKKEESTTKEAIAYRFHSEYLYYPLAISGIGGTGFGKIDLVVMTPGDINVKGALEQEGNSENVQYYYPGVGVKFTMDEVKALDPALSGVFGDRREPVNARNFILNTRDIGGFKDDFVAVPAAR